MSPSQCRARFADLSSGEVPEGEDDGLDDLLDLLDDDEAPPARAVPQPSGASIAPQAPVNITGTGVELSGRTLAAAADFDFDAEAALAQGDAEMARLLDSAIASRRAGPSAALAAGAGEATPADGEALLRELDEQAAVRSARHAEARRSVFDRVAAALGAHGDTAAAREEAALELGLPSRGGAAVVIPAEAAAAGGRAGRIEDGTAAADGGEARGPGGRSVRMEPDGSTYWASERARLRRARGGGSAAGRGAEDAEEEAAAAASSAPGWRAGEAGRGAGAGDEDSDSFDDEPEGGSAGEGAGSAFLSSLPAGEAIRSTPLGMQIAMAADAAAAAGRQAERERRRAGARMAAGGGAVLGLDPSLQELLSEPAPARPAGAPLTPLGEILEMLSRPDGAAVAPGVGAGAASGGGPSGGEDEDEEEDDDDASLAAASRRSLKGGRGRGAGAGAGTGGGGASSPGAVAAGAAAAGGASRPSAAAAAAAAVSSSQAGDDDGSSGDEMDDEEWEARLEAAAARVAAEARPGPGQDRAAAEEGAGARVDGTAPPPAAEEEGAAAAGGGSANPALAASASGGVVVPAGDSMWEGWAGAAEAGLGPSGGAEESKEEEEEEAEDEAAPRRRSAAGSASAAAAPAVASLPPAAPSPPSTGTSPPVVSGGASAARAAASARREAERRARSHGEGPASLSVYHHAAATAGWCPSARPLLGPAPACVALAITLRPPLCLGGALTAAGEGALASLLASPFEGVGSAVDVLGMAMTTEAAARSALGGAAAPVAAAGRRAVLACVAAGGGGEAAARSWAVASLMGAGLSPGDAQRCVESSSEGGAAARCLRLLHGPHAFAMARLRVDPRCDAADDAPPPGPWDGAMASSWARASSGAAASDLTVGVAFPAADGAGPDGAPPAARVVATALAAARRAGVYVAGARLAWPAGAEGSLLDAPAAWRGGLAPAVALLLRGHEAAERWSDAVGPSNVRAAAVSAPGSVRGSLGTRALEAPSSREAAEREAAWWFGGRLLPEGREAGDPAGAVAARGVPLAPGEVGAETAWTGPRGDVGPASPRLPLVALAPPSLVVVEASAAAAPRGGMEPRHPAPRQAALSDCASLLAGARLGILGTRLPADGGPARILAVGEAAHDKAASALAAGAADGVTAAVLCRWPGPGGDAAPLSAMLPAPAAGAEAGARRLVASVRALWSPPAAAAPGARTRGPVLTGLARDDDGAGCVSAALVLVSADALLPAGEAIADGAPGPVLRPPRPHLPTSADDADRSGLPGWLEAHCPRRDAPVAALLARLLGATPPASAWCPLLPDDGPARTAAGGPGGTSHAAPERAADPDAARRRPPHGSGVVLLASASFPLGIPGTSAAPALVDALAAATQPPHGAAAASSAHPCPPSLASAAERSAWWRGLLRWHLTSRPVAAFLVAGPGAAEAAEAAVGPTRWADVCLAAEALKAASRTARAAGRGASGLRTTGRRAGAAQRAAAEARAAADARSFRAASAVDPLRSAAVVVSAPSAVARLAAELFGAAGGAALADASRAAAASSRPVAAGLPWSLALEPRPALPAWPGTLLPLLAPPSLSSWSFAVAILRPAALASGAFAALSRCLREWAAAGLTVEAVRCGGLRAAAADVIGSSHAWALRTTLLAATGLETADADAADVARASAAGLNGPAAAVLLTGPRALEAALRAAGPPRFADDGSGASVALRRVVEQEWSAKRAAGSPVDAGSAFASARSDALRAALRARYDAQSAGASGRRMSLRALLGTGAIEEAIHVSPTAEHAAAELRAVFPDLAEGVLCRAAWGTAGGATAGRPEAGPPPDPASLSATTSSDAAQECVDGPPEAAGPGSRPQTCVLVVAPSVAAPVLCPPMHAGAAVRMTSMAVADPADGPAAEGVSDASPTTRDRTAWLAAAARLPALLDALGRGGFSLAGLKTAALSLADARSLVASVRASGARVEAGAEDAMAAGTCLVIAAHRDGAVGRLRTDLSSAAAVLDPPPFPEDGRRAAGPDAAGARAAGRSRRLGLAASGIAACACDEPSSRRVLAALFRPEELVAGPWRLQPRAGSQAAARPSRAAAVAEAAEPEAAGWGGGGAEEHKEDEMD